MSKKNKKTEEIIIDAYLEEPIIIEQKIEQPTIYDKYNKYIEQYNSGCLYGLTYPEAMEILRYCEKQLDKQIPMNMNCGSCMMDLIKLFKNLR